MYHGFVNCDNLSQVRDSTLAQNSLFGLFGLFAKATMHKSMVFQNRSWDS